MVRVGNSGIDKVVEVVENKYKSAWGNVPALLLRFHKHFGCERLLINT